VVEDILVVKEKEETLVQCKLFNLIVRIYLIFNDDLGVHLVLMDDMESKVLLGTEVFKEKEVLLLTTQNLEKKVIKKI
jgi:hypothetical protein